jgi:hypothetical protein
MNKERTSKPAPQPAGAVATRRTQPITTGTVTHAGPTAPAARALPAPGSGMPMPAAVQARMEHAFGADFSAVRIHQDAQARAISALAFARGMDVHFAPGQYDPDSQRGQELLGHELAHVVQQSQGRVSAPGQGTAIREDPALEQEADALGRMAARAGAPAGPLRATASARGDGAIQAKRDLAAPSGQVIQRTPSPADLPRDLVGEMLGSATSWTQLARMTTTLRLVSKAHRDAVDQVIGGNDRASSLRYWLERVLGLRPSTTAFPAIAIITRLAADARAPELWEVVAAVLGLPGLTAGEILLALGVRDELADKLDYVEEAVQAALAAGMDPSLFLADYARAAAQAGIDVSLVLADLEPVTPPRAQGTGKTERDVLSALDNDHVSDEEYFSLSEDEDEGRASKEKEEELLAEELSSDEGNEQFHDPMPEVEFVAAQPDGEPGQALIHLLQPDLRRLLVPRKNGDFSVDIPGLLALLQAYRRLLQDAARHGDAARDAVQAKLGALDVQMLAVQDKLRELVRAGLKEQVIILSPRQKDALESSVDAAMVFVLLDAAATSRYSATSEYQKQRQRQKADEQSNKYWAERKRKEEARNKAAAVGLVSEEPGKHGDKDEQEDGGSKPATSSPELTIKVAWLREQSGSVTSLADDTQAPTKPLYRHNAGQAGKKFLKWRYRATFSDGRPAQEFYITMPLSTAALKGDESDQTDNMHAQMEQQLRAQHADFAEANIIVTKQT